MRSQSKIKMPTKYQKIYEETSKRRKEKVIYKSQKANLS